MFYQFKGLWEMKLRYLPQSRTTSKRDDSPDECGRMDKTS